LKPQKSITILGPAVPPTVVSYEADKSLAYVSTTTTTVKPIAITSEQSPPSLLLPSSSIRPETPYELEEQLIYELPVNKSANVVEHTTRINYINDDDHREDVIVPELPYGPIELYKPHVNLTTSKVNPVSNEFTYYKAVKINPNPEINKNPKKEYYEKDIDNDYDGK
jgi:hypothetical protein